MNLEKPENKIEGDTKPNEKVVHQGKTIELVEKLISRDGKNFTVEFARRSPGTRLIIEKDGKLILSREFRHELGRYDYRLPGGKVFDSLVEYNTALDQNVDLNEAAKQGALKEAREEVGVDAQDASFIYKSINGATVEWDLYYFVIKDFKQTAQDLGEGEDIQIEIVDKEKAKEMCLDGSISEDRSAIVLLRYLNGK